MKLKNACGDGTPSSLLINYIEWVNDISGSSDDISFTNLEAKKFGDNDTFHLSGVKYFVSPTGSFGVTVDKIYTNVYSGESNAIRIQNHSGIIGSTATNIEQNGTGINNTAKGSSGNSVALANERCMLAEMLPVIILSTALVISADLNCIRVRDVLPIAASVGSG